MDGFLVQASRVLHALSGAFVGVTYSPITGKASRTLRSIPRKTALEFGRLVNGALGTAAVVIVEAMMAQERKRRAEREAVLNALREPVAA
jgi:hypothetical protein